MWRLRREKEKRLVVAMDADHADVLSIEIGDGEQGHQVINRLPRWSRDLQEVPWRCANLERLTSLFKNDLIIHRVLILLEIGEIREAIHSTTDTATSTASTNSSSGSTACDGKFKRIGEKEIDRSPKEILTMTEIVSRGKETFIGIEEEVGRGSRVDADGKRKMIKWPSQGEDPLWSIQEWNEIKTLNPMQIFETISWVPTASSCLWWREKKAEVVELCRVDEKLLMLKPELMFFALDELRE
jgi:hypothetical protein